MGRAKGLLTLGDRPLLRAHVDGFQAAGLLVNVVLGWRADDHAAVLPADVRVFLNPRWAETGMAESLALACAADVAYLVTPVDTPPARPETLRRLLAHPGDAVPVFDGRPGHPLRIDPPHPPGRLDLRLARARRVAVDDPDVLLNLNTPADWAAWRREGARREQGGGPVGWSPMPPVRRLSEP